MRLFKRFKLNVMALVLAVIITSAIGVFAGSGTGIPVHRVSGGISTNMVRDSKVWVLTMDYLTALLQGDIFTDRELFSLTGHSDVINTGDQVFWSVPPATQTEYVWPTSGATITVESSSANDDVGNTGATQATVSGLLDDYTKVTENIALDGVTPVAGAVLFFRVNEVKVTAAGTTGYNEGNLTIKQGANILSYVEIRSNISEQLIYTTAVNEELDIVEMKGSGAGTKNVHVHVFFREFGGLFTSDNHRTVNNSTYEMSHLKIPEKSDLLGIVHSDTNGGVADITVEGILRDI
jgi:hypothetical protein